MSIFNYITKIDKFNSNIVDNEPIIENKKYFNIYNNTIDEPLHKFWFIIENAKFINSYDDYKVLRFALNQKSEKNVKLIDFLKNLLIYVETLFKHLYPDVKIEMPWKEYTNYPYIMNIIKNTSTRFIDSNKNNKDINELNKEDTYSVLFEISYIQFIKINNISSLKIKLSAVMIQEKKFDITKYSLEQKNIPVPSINITPLNVINNEKSDTSITQKLLFNPLQLLEKKNQLRKISNTKKDNDEDSDKDIKHEINEIKGALKKVETTEKSLLPYLKEEYKQKIMVEYEDELEKDLLNIL